MADVLYEDLHAHILSYIHESSTLFTISRSLPTSHPLFTLVLRRLCHLPWPLSCPAARSMADVHRILDLLISSSAPTTRPFPIVEALRHLVVETTPVVWSKGTISTQRLRGRLVELFRVTRNLRVLDWCGKFGPSREQIRVLGGIGGLEVLHVDCGYSEQASWEETSWRKIDEFLAVLGPNLKYLDLRRVNLKVYKALETHKSLLSSYHSLERLSLDLTEGVWDWNGAGSPQSGASSDFKFANLGFPALKHLEMRVGDLTISAERAGPMDLVNWETLESLGLFVDPCIFPSSIRNLLLFTSLPPSSFPLLTRLEIRDTIRDASPWKWPDAPSDPHAWAESGRSYRGLVPTFLASIREGGLPNLVRLWVNQEVLCMPRGGPDHEEEYPEFYGVGELWKTGGDGEEEEEEGRKREWMGILRSVLGRMESLRVGFGAMEAEEVGLVLGCCDTDKLSQFGFQYKWRVADRDSVIPPALLAHFTPFPHLTDIHLLQIRPGTQHTYRSPSRTTLSDVRAIFASNPSLCRVGFGQNTVWERRSFPFPHAAGGELEVEDKFVLAQDGFMDPRHVGEGAVPRFFDVGPVEAYYAEGEGEGEGEGAFEPRPGHAEEIREIRGILERTLGPRSAAGENIDT